VVSQQLEIPTIGIGAGVGCDGQVLVTHDLLGLFDRFTPRFVKKYAQLHAVMADAFVAYRTDVEHRTFPAPEHTVEMADEAWQAFVEAKGSQGDRAPRK
jgi:3-methyl-2-oxobutanoate hydroxymethyltransferase